LLVPAAIAWGTRHPPREANAPDGCDGTRVPTATRGPLWRPQETRASLLESLVGSRGPHGPGGCLSAPTFGDLCPGPYFGFPLRSLIGSLALGLEPLKAGSGSPPLLALHRYRSTQASWICGHPNRPSRRRSLAPWRTDAHPRPVAGQRRGHYRHAPQPRG